MGRNKNKFNFQMKHSQLINHTLWKPNWKRAWKLAGSGKSSAELQSST